jgi:hypothetical protein
MLICFSLSVSLCLLISVCFLLSVSLCLFPSVCFSLSVSVSLCLSLSISASLYLFLPLRLSIASSLCLSLPLFLSFSFSFSIYLSVSNLSLCGSLCLFLFLTFLTFSLFHSLFLPFSLSANLSGKSWWSNHGLIKLMCKYSFPNQYFLFRLLFTCKETNVEITVLPKKQLLTKQRYPFIDQLEKK